MGAHGVASTRTYYPKRGRTHNNDHFIFEIGACPGRLGPAVGEPDSHVFTSHAIHASHALPCAPNRLPAPLGSGRDRRDAYRVTIMRTTAGVMRHKAQEGSTAAAVHVQTQHCTSQCRSPRRRDARSLASWQRPAHPGTCSGRSRHANDVPRSLKPLRPSAPSRGKVGGVSTWKCGRDGLASAVRARLPSARPARLQRSSSGAPSAHPVLDSPASAGEAALLLTSSSSASSFRETGFIVAWRIASSRPL